MNSNNNNNNNHYTCSYSELEVRLTASLALNEELASRLREAESTIEDLTEFEALGDEYDGCDDRGLNALGLPELDNCSGQQLRDELSRLNGKPQGKRSSGKLSTKQKLIEEILRIRNQQQSKKS